MKEPEALELPGAGAPSPLSTMQRLLLWLGPALGLMTLTVVVLLGVWQWWSSEVVERSLAAIRAQQETLQLSLAGLDTRLSQREAYAEELTGRVERLSARLSAVDISDADNAVVGLQRILIRQERDYRDFLSSLQRSLMSLDRVIPRSGGWWGELETDLEESLSLSEARENYVFNLRE